MKLHIYSLKKVLYDGAAESLNVRSLDGELTILDMHRPLITPLVRGPLKIRHAGEETNIEINSGYLEVKPEGRVTVLVND